MQFRVSRLIRNIGKWSVMYWPVLVLAVVSFTLFVTNYVPGTFLVGWDSTVPELSLWLNLKRFIFGVWQEYRGLGTLDGMAHTANVVYWFYAAFLSLILPLNMVRYVVQLFCHFLGGVGLYFLSLFVLQHLFPHSKKIASQSISLLAALLYMLNFMTIQMFYLPLELFSLHFLALPWIVFSLLKHLEKPSVKSLMVFVLLNFLTASQAHVPTIFIALCFPVGFLLLGELLSKFSWKTFQVVFLTGVCFAAIHGWWAFSYAYSAAVKPAEISASKINRFSTNDIFYRNAAFGDALSVLRFGSFNIDYLDWDSKTFVYSPMMKGWQQHYDSPIITGLNVAISISGLLGLAIVIFLAIKHKKPLLIVLGLSGFFAFSMLATDTFGVGLISLVLREYVPLFHEIFRFTFTKFSFFYVAYLSLGFAVVIATITQPLVERKWYVPFGGVIGLCAAVILFVSIPAFLGYFFYPELRRVIPQDYFSLQTFFDQQPANTRIAIFPIQSFYGWTTNTWGFRGSGFLWQMLPQPTLDRAFDAWSKQNETFYDQIRAAVIAKDLSQIQTVLAQYRVQWIVVDKSLFQPGSTTTTDQLQSLALLFEQANLKETARFGNISVYKFNDLTLDPFLSNVTSIQDYNSSYTDFDQAYQENKEYVSSASGIQYPFSFLQQEFTDLAKNTQLKYDNNDIVVTAQLASNARVTAPSYLQSEQTIITDVSTQRTDTTLNVIFQPLLPTIEGEKDVKAQEINLSFPLNESTEKYFLVVNDRLFPISSSTNKTVANRMILNTKKENYIAVYTGNPELNRNIFDDYQKLPVTDCFKDLTKTWKVEKNEKSGLELTSLNASACVTAALPQFQRDVIQDEKIPLEHARKLVITESRSSSKTDNIPAHCLREKGNYQCINLTQEAVNQSGNQMLRTYSEIDGGNQYALDIVNKFREPDKSESITYSDLVLDVYPLVGEQQFTVDTQVSDAAALLSEQLAKYKSSTLTLRVPSIEISLLPNTQLHSYAKSFERVPALNCDQAKRGSISRTENTSAMSYSAQDKGSLCESFKLSGLPLNQEYVYRLQGKVKSGVGLRGNIFNPTSTNLEIEINSGIGTFDVFYPFSLSQDIYKFSEPLRAHFTVPSYGREINAVDIERLSLSPLPTNWLKQIKTSPQTPFYIAADGSVKLERKIGTAFYKVNAKLNKDGYVVLPQTFEKGWVAITTDGQILTTHTLFNGWANAWLVKSGTHTIMIVYLPQLLSFMGWILTSTTLLISTIAFVRKYFSRSRSLENVSREL